MAGRAPPLIPPIAISVIAPSGRGSGRLCTGRRTPLDDSLLNHRFIINEGLLRLIRPTKAPSVNGTGREAPPPPGLLCFGVGSSSMIGVLVGG